MTMKAIITATAVLASYATAAPATAASWTAPVAPSGTAPGLFLPVADLGDVGGGLGGGGGPGGGGGGGAGGGGGGGGGGASSDRDTGGGSGSEERGGSSERDPLEGAMAKQMADLRQAENNLKFLEQDLGSLESARATSSAVVNAQVLAAVDVRLVALEAEAGQLTDRPQNLDNRLDQIRERFQAITAPPADASFSAEEGYEQGERLLSLGRVDEAQRLFREVLAALPEDELAAKAQFGLGETLFIHKDYSEAGWIYAQGYQRDEDGPFAADSLLKLGMALGHLHKLAEACATFDKLDADFPDAPDRIESSLQRERRSAGCR
jgi:TolA-binding protein